MAIDAVSIFGQLLADPAVILAAAVPLVASVILSPPLARRTNASRPLSFGLLASAFLVIVATLVLGRELFAGGITPNLGLVSGCFDGSIHPEWNSSSLPNVLLYSPLTFFALLVFRNRLPATIAGLTGVVVAVELIQNLLDLGVCQELDILENLLGVLIGLGMAKLYDVVGRRAGRGR